MRIGVPLETRAGETRVAATPETVKKLISQGHQVLIQMVLVWAQANPMLPMRRLAQGLALHPMP